MIDELTKILLMTRAGGKTPAPFLSDGFFGFFYVDNEKKLVPAREVFRRMILEYPIYSLNFII